MASEQSNNPQPIKDEAIVTQELPLEGVASLIPANNTNNVSVMDSKTTPCASNSSSTQTPETDARPLFNTPQGRIAAYKRLARREKSPEQRANFEALIKYYEEGGKLPQGDEELWAFDGQVSMGNRLMVPPDQLPEGWLYKTTYCDTNKVYSMNYVPPPETMLSDSHGRVYL